MRKRDQDKIVAATAREIDPHAFAERPLTDALIRRQEAATRKAVDILSDPLKTITLLLDELQEADRHIEEVRNILRTLTDNLHLNLGPAAERRRSLLIQFGRLDPE